MNQIVSIVGSSNSGKTTLIEKIIPRLKEKGYKIGALKHDAHNFEIDREGKDSWRMSASGADMVAIASKNKLAFIKVLDCEEKLDEIAERLFSDADIIITEGYKAENKPKIEVVRHKALLTSPSDNLIAVVDNTLEEVEYSLPKGYETVHMMNMKDIDCIVSFIEDKFLKTRVYP